MLLTADVGNTNIKLGIFDGEKLRYKLRFSTNEKMTSDEFAVELYTFFQIYQIDYSRIDGSSRCSTRSRSSSACTAWWWDPG